MVGLLLLLFPQLGTTLCFFVLTLALLLLARRPSRLADLPWLAVVPLLMIGWTKLPAALLSVRITGASALFFAGFFALLTVAGVRLVIHRVMLAAALTTATVIGALQVSGFSYAGFRATLTSELWTALRAADPQQTLPEQMPVSTGLNLDPSAYDALSMPQKLADLVTAFSHYVGSYLTFLAAISAWLAWRCAGWPRRPDDPPSTRGFADFRFTDHYVWVLIALIALALVPLPVWAADLNRNLLAVTLILYGARGAAILWPMLLRTPPVLRAGIVTVAVVLLFAPIFFGCVVLGVADTWFDLRQRMPPQGVPT